jgi:hypothetical protein
LVATTAVASAHDRLQSLLGDVKSGGAAGDAFDAGPTAYDVDVDDDVYGLDDFEDILEMGTTSLADRVRGGADTKAVPKAKAAPAPKARAAPKPKASTKTVSDVLEDADVTHLGSSSSSSSSSSAFAFDSVLSPAPVAKARKPAVKRAKPPASKAPRHRGQSEEDDFEFDDDADDLAAPIVAKTPKPKRRAAGTSRAAQKTYVLSSDDDDEEDDEDWA